MRVFLRTLASVVVLLSVPTAAPAQGWDQPWADPMDRPGRVDVSGSVGFLLPTDWSNLVLLGSISSSSGVLEQVLVRDIRVEPDTEYAGAFTYWRGRYGFQVKGGYSKSSLTIGGAPLDASGLQPASLGVKTWMYEVRGAVGFLEYEPLQWIWPYGFFGLGGITYDLKRTLTPPLLTFIQRAPAAAAGTTNVVVNRNNERQFLLSVDELGTETVFAFSLGVGTDVRVPGGPAGVGLRFEVSDTISGSPLTLQVRELVRRGGLDAGDNVDFGLVHHLSATAGLVLRIGR